MLHFRILAVCIVLLLAPDLGQAQPPARDQQGDALPPGAVGRLGTVRFRHDTPIAFAAFLPGGKRIVSVSSDSVVCVWEFPSGKPLHRFEAYPAEERNTAASRVVGDNVNDLLVSSRTQVTGATLSPNGKHLTVFCGDGFLRVWDLANARQLGKVALNGANHGSAGPLYSPDGKTLVLTTRVLQLVDLPSGKQIGPRLGHSDSVTFIGFTPDGKQIVTKDARTVRTWDAATGKELSTTATNVPDTFGTQTLISPDGRVGVTVARFASPTVARTAKVREATLFDPVSGKKLGEIGLATDVTPYHRRPILFSADGNILAASTADTPPRINLYEVPSGKLLRTLETRPVDPPAGGKRGGFKGLGVRGGRGGPGGLAGGRGGFGGFGAGTAEQLLISPRGKILAFQQDLGSPILVLDTVTGKKIASLMPTRPNAALHGTFSPDGRCLVLEENDGTVTFYELATGQPRRKYGSKLPPGQTSRLDRTSALLSSRLRRSLLGEPSRVGIALSPNGNLLALTNPAGSVHVWDVLTGKEIAVLKGHTGAANALAFSPDGKTLASASHDTTALLWDVTRIPRPAAPAGTLKLGDLDHKWQALADNNAAAAFAAMSDLGSVPKEAVDWIKAHVKPATPLDAKRVQQLLKELDANQFKVREHATGELLKLGEPTLRVIDAALAGNPTPESRRRLQELRTRLTVTGLSGERLRIVRAVELLERIGTPQARQVLQALANGEPGALVTRSAQAALKR